MPVNLSYPKPRDVLMKAFTVARTDNATEKCVLPKDAVVVDVRVLQDVNASSAAGAVTVSCGADADGILNAFSMATTAVGLVAPGTAYGSSIGVKLTADAVVKSTYTVGSSTAGGTGTVFIYYIVPGPGENHLS
jgi:hypothetical protein